MSLWGSSSLGYHEGEGGASKVALAVAGILTEDGATLWEQEAGH